ncbi:MAG: hypothetical protein BWY77_01916 [bacterium ADurb.Bin431]|nr:MAG: hypothetical protein BWY77_01916 [bacterium ADurb.Bin431]
MPGQGQHALVQGECAGDDRAVAAVGHLDRVAVGELDLEQGLRIGGPLRRDRPAENLLVGTEERVLEDAGLMADMHEVFVLAVGFGDRGLDRDGPFFGKGDHIAAPLELGEEFRILPGRDDLNVGLEGVVSQLEADLIVALAGGAMRDIMRSLPGGDLDLTLGDERAGDGGAEEIAAFVKGVAARRRKDVLLHQLLFQILDVDLAGAGLEGFLTDSLKVLLLADVGDIGDDVIALELEPLEDHGGIEAAAVGEDHFLFHDRPFLMDDDEKIPVVRAE